MEFFDYIAKKDKRKSEKMIGQYSVYQWILFFYVYSFLGWIFESAYVSLLKRKWVNRGFLRGPFLPIYGGGAVMMLFVSYPFKSNLLLTYFAGVAGATLLELVTGILMESIFKIRYWDYSKQPFNYKGYICLSSSAAWGFFTIGMNEVLHPWVLRGISLVPSFLLHILMGLVSVCFLVDIIISVEEALDLRNMLEKMEEIHGEMLRLRKRADVVIACLDDSWKEFMENSPAIDRLEEVYKEIELRYHKIRQSILDKEIETDSHKTELGELKEKFVQLFAQVEQYREERRKKARKLKGRIMANPTMTSSRYQHALESLKEKVKESCQPENDGQQPENETNPERKTSAQESDAGEEKSGKSHGGRRSKPANRE